MYARNLPINYAKVSDLSWRYNFLWIIARTPWKHFSAYLQYHVWMESYEKSTYKKSLKLSYKELITYNITITGLKVRRKKPTG